jgi:hypothetical protein
VPPEYQLHGAWLYFDTNSVGIIDESVGETTDDRSRGDGFQLPAFGAG